jgi:hypothetical protein
MRAFSLEARAPALRKACIVDSTEVKTTTTPRRVLSCLAASSGRVTAGISILSNASAISFRASIGFVQFKRRGNVLKK